MEGCGVEGCGVGGSAGRAHGVEGCGAEGCSVAGEGSCGMEDLRARCVKRAR